MNKDLKDELSVLFEKYSKNLPAKIEKIEQLWNQLKEKWDIEILSKLNVEIHGLHGSGKSYGYPALSDRAQCLEKLLRSFSEKEIPSVDQMNQVQALLTNLKQSASPTFQQ